MSRRLLSVGFSGLFAILTPALSEGALLKVSFVASDEYSANANISGWITMPLDRGHGPVAWEVHFEGFDGWTDTWISDSASASGSFGVDKGPYYQADLEQEIFNLYAEDDSGWFEISLYQAWGPELGTDFPHCGWFVSENPADLVHYNPEGYCGEGDTYAFNYEWRDFELIRQQDNLDDGLLRFEVLEVPEPSLILLWLLGCLGIAAGRRRIGP